MTLLSEDEAEPIHSAIIRKEPWTVDAVRRLRAEADKRLREGPWSVTTDRPVDPSLDPHDFYDEAPFWWPDPANPAAPWVRREGQINPDRSVADKNALDATCDSIFTLGAASFFLDDPRYGRHAAHLINTWFLNPKTRMNPHLEYSQAIRGLNEARGGTIDGRVFIRAVQGMEFLAQSGQWDAREAAATHKWFEDYLRWLTHSKTGSDDKIGGNIAPPGGPRKWRPWPPSWTTRPLRRWRLTITAIPPSRGRLAPMETPRAMRSATVRSLIPPSTPERWPPPAASPRRRAWTCGARRAKAGPPWRPSSHTWLLIWPTGRSGTRSRSRNSKPMASTSWPSPAWE